MAVKTLSDEILIVTLSSEPKANVELGSFNEKISDDCNSDVIIDFSYVQVLTSPSISNLLVLRSLLNDCGRKLVLCNVAVITKCIFDVAGLDSVFKFANDRSAALTMIRNTRNRTGYRPSSKKNKHKFASSKSNGKS